MKVKLMKEEICFIDKEDYSKIKHLNLYLSTHGYVTFHLPKKQPTLLHRFLMGFPKKDSVDHVNGNKLDNQKTNLRVCTHSENMRNSKMRKTNKIGLKGVSKVTKSNLWRARIHFNKKEIYLGLYKTPEKAHRAYAQASKKYHKEYGKEK